ATASLKAAKTLRAAGIAAEVYPDMVKMKKQMAYADAMRIPFVAIIGETELESGTVTIKDMEAGNQESVSLDDLVARLS
ncbi:MAG: histidine--tRNA ligase, partial [Muribaculum intestinale]|nr:histidine--tRNA ligase [Muribaculum intestinale]